MSLKRWNYNSGQEIPAFKTVFTSMDKFLNSFYFSPTERLVPMDVVEIGNAYELRIAIPGLTKDDIKVDVKEGCLSVEAKKVEEEGANYLYKGLSSFEFNRCFSDLDENLKVDMGSISSKYRNGLLIISLPKKKEAMPREISVEVS
jgi:HSP20 family protein